ncbi:hypothetical protein [Mycolicibacterium sp. CBMA 213]|uniref:hypothetical protein n=1 Tax=Mycolicibacterium sp. CBMA 213 TaxID=1968788 RepID=UPI001FB7942B|nr:hypothetical protein [Mycolicibacterium sp. CBMA 213]
MTELFAKVLFNALSADLSFGSSAFGIAKGQSMSIIRSAILLGASALGAGVIALIGATAASADTGINITPGNNGLLNGGGGNTGIANNLLGPGFLNSGVANGLLGGSLNHGLANLGNCNTGVLGLH